MIVRALNVLNDWTYGKGKNNYLKNSKAVAQNIQTRLSSFLGDCYFNIGFGIDWFNLLGSKNLLGLKLAIASTILNTRGVTGIVELSIELDQNRRLSIRYSVNTVYTGITRPNGEVIAPVTGNFLLTENGDILTTESGDPLVTETT